MFVFYISFFFFTPYKYTIKALSFQKQQCIYYRQIKCGRLKSQTLIFPLLLATISISINTFSNSSMLFTKVHGIPWIFESFQGNLTLQLTKTSSAMMWEINSVFFSSTFSLEGELDVKPCLYFSQHNVMSTKPSRISFVLFCMAEDKMVYFIISTYLVL